MLSRPAAADAGVPPPPEEQAIGLRTYLSRAPGIGGRLRAEVEDFRVIELGPGPRHAPEGPYTAARVRLRNWETNRFAGIAARRAGIKPGQVGFAGMKDKRAVTEQWFTFRAHEAAVARVGLLDDVDILEMRRCRERQYAGAHDGNRFVLRVRDGRRDATVRGDVEAIRDAISAEGGVPRFFGPQRFGAAFRPVTHRIGAAIVAGDLEEAVRLFVGNPVATEREEARAARTVYEETRDAAAALEVFPHNLDPERRVLERLVRRPGDWRHALTALPQNLQQLFVHAHQSLMFNEAVSDRVAAGLGLRTAHVGDIVCGVSEDGTRVHRVDAWNRARVQREIDRGRAAPTAPLPGLDTPTPTGTPGEVEAATLERLGVDPRAFRCREMPHLASAGRRRTVLQVVRDLDVAWEDDDPVFSFALGKGEYATVVLREFMKAPLDAY